MAKSGHSAAADCYLTVLCLDFGELSFCCALSLHAISAMTGLQLVHHSSFVVI